MEFFRKHGTDWFLDVRAEPAGAGGAEDRRPAGSCASAGRRVGAKWEQHPPKRDGMGAKREQKTRKG